MNEEITAHTTFDVASMRTGYRWHKRAQGWQKWATRMLPLIFLFGAWQLRSIETTDRIMGGIFVGMAVFTGLIRVIEPRIIEKSVRSSPACGSSIQYDFCQEKISMKAPGLESTFAWPQIMETKTTPDGALIYMQRLMFYWLPKTAFTTEADYSRFLALLAAKTKHSQIA